MFKVLVIIVTYNGMKWYDRCLDGLRQSTIPVQTIVIDNKSTDDSVNYIRNNFPEVHLIESKTNLGFGRANNLGFEYALKNEADYVYLLNQDAWIEPNTIEGLIEILKKDPTRGIISPMQCNGVGDKLDLNFQDLLRPSNCENIMSDIYLGQLKDFYPVKSVMAAHWLISINALKKIGGFSPVFSHYGEDNNYLDRCLYHKLQVGISPLLKSFHDRELRKESNSKIIYRYYTQLLVSASNPNKGRIIYFFKDYWVFLIIFFTKVNTFKDIKYLFNIGSIINAFRYSKKSTQEGAFLKK